LRRPSRHPPSPSAPPLPPRQESARWMPP
jgi:hypothetical protein